MQTKLITGDANYIEKKMAVLRNDGWTLKKMFPTGGKIGVYLEHA